MIELKRCNYISSKDWNSISSTMYRIIGFLELDDWNFLMFVPDFNKQGSKFSLNVNKILFNDYNHFLNLIHDKSVLFRANILIFDFFEFSEKQIKFYQKEIDKLKLQYIIITCPNSYSYNNKNNDVTDYYVEIKIKDKPPILSTTLPPTLSMGYQIFVTDKINNWKTDLNSLRVSYIRNKKIDDIFGD